MIPAKIPPDILRRDRPKTPAKRGKNGLFEAKRDGLKKRPARREKKRSSQRG